MEVQEVKQHTPKPVIGSDVNPGRRVFTARVPNHFIQEDYITIDWHLSLLQSYTYFYSNRNDIYDGAVDSGPVTLAGLQVEAGTLSGFLSQTSATQGASGENE